MSMRKASVVRTTDQTEVRVTLDLDGSGRCAIETGVPLLDQALVLMARYGSFDLSIRCSSGIAPPASVMEDAGLCLGLAFDKAYGERHPALRAGLGFASADDHLARAVVEIAGSPCLVYRVSPPGSPAGDIDIVMLESFWRAFAAQAGVNLHIELLYGNCGLPALEAVCKASARALRDACSR